MLILVDAGRLMSPPPKTRVRTIVVMLSTWLIGDQDVIVREMSTSTHFSIRFVTTWCVQVLGSPKEAFTAVMQSWRERCEKCVCLQGDYVEK